MDLKSSWWSLSPSACVSALESDQRRGLSSDEARRRLEKYGRNELPHEEGDPLWKRFLQQFDDKLVKILLGAALISLLLALEHVFTALVSGGDWWGLLKKAFFDGELVEAFVIMMILILNAAVGVWQESKADKAIEALKEYAALDANVIRDGQLSVIRATELVPGDIIEVSRGDKVPADARILEFHSTAVKTEQMALTGESDAVNKQVDAVAPSADLSGKKNMIFSGTDIVHGKVRCLVTSTGSSTLIGSLHRSLLDTEDRDSPLKEKLDKFGDFLTNVIMVICGLVFLVHLPDLETHGGLFRGSMYYAKIAIALAVAAIPEGLPAVVTTCLALGTRRMAAKNAIVRHLPSVETLGCTQVICSDKTGTLTTNQMAVMRMLVPSSKNTGMDEFHVEGVSFEPRGEIFQLDAEGRRTKVENLFANNENIKELSRVATLCNQSTLMYNAEKNAWQRQGESTEASLKVLAEKIGVPENSGTRTPANDYWQSRYSNLATLEFASDRRSMSVLVTEAGAAGAAPSSATKRVTRASASRVASQLLVKGAPESILGRCTRIRRGNNTVPLTADVREAILAKVKSDYACGRYALRCLAFAVIEETDLTPDNPRLADPGQFVEIESNMTYIGLVGIRDPPREEVRGAITKCRRAGIRVIIITGDLKETAESIAKQIGVFDEGEDLTGKSYTAREFFSLSEAQQIEAVGRASLFSRTEHSHKQKLVELLQTHHKAVTAMTGDGVNDAPALKAADIGIAMGSGTAVAKEASRMVLADDNFATIVNAVEEGRAIYNNTKAFIRYLISSNIGEVVAIFLAAALLIPEPLVPITLLWVNLVTDGLPATALSFNPPESDVMSRPPRRRDESLVDGWGFFRYLVIGVYVGVATVFGYIWWQTMYEGGPLVTFAQLRDFRNCEAKGFQLANGFSCSDAALNPFESRRPMTVSLTVLVVIEMFNALNALSENDSLLVTPPWVNPGLITAIFFSLAQHFVILYTGLGAVFNVTALNMDEIKAAVVFSFPVILLDETLKFVARMRERKRSRAVSDTKKRG